MNIHKRLIPLLLTDPIIGSLSWRKHSRFLMSSSFSFNPFSLQQTSVHPRLCPAKLAALSVPARLSEIVSFLAFYLKSKFSADSLVSLVTIFTDTAPAIHLHD